jgi:hypothetical protein
MKLIFTGTTWISLFTIHRIARPTHRALAQYDLELHVDGIPHWFTVRCTYGN